jgi:hypothetical protein
MSKKPKIGVEPSDTFRLAIFDLRPHQALKAARRPTKTVGNIRAGIWDDRT